MSYLLQELVDRIFDRFGTPVTLVDAEGNLVAYSAQPVEATDEVRRRTTLMKELDAPSAYVHEQARPARGFSRIPAAPGLGVLERVVVPLRVGPVVTGRLFLVDPERRVPPEIVDEYASLLRQAARVIEILRFPQFEKGNLLGVALCAPKGQRRLAIEHLLALTEGEFSGGGRVMAVACEGHGAALADEKLAAVMPRAVWSQIAGMLVALIPGGAAEPAALARRAVDHIAAGAGGGTALAGLGSAAPSLEGARRSYREALEALRLANAGLAAPPVADWDRLGAWRSLLAMRRKDAERSLDPRVADLVRQEDPEMLRTTSRYLERGASVGGLAEELHMHRATLYARNKRLQERYRLDWDDPEDRLATVVGLRIALLHRTWLRP